jgi:ornithine cyclodeaminase
VVLILSDTDVARSCTASRAIAVIRRALHAHGEGRLSAPPRAYNDITPGRLVYTAGALEELVHGVRIYDHADSEQVVAVWDSQTRRLAAVVLGAELGRRRTGAIGAVAIDTLARPDATTLGIIGTGHQSWTQVWAATAVRNWSHVKVYSRNPYWRERFAARCREQLLVDAEAVGNPRTAFRHRDAVIVATNSPTPVFDTSWLEPGMHVTTVGPKTLSNHEIPLDLLDRIQIVVTDSLVQVHGSPEPSALSTRRMVELGAILVGAVPGRTDPEQITLFCSVGLAGTEVILAADLAGLPTALPARVVAEVSPPVSSAALEAISAPTDENLPSTDGDRPRPAIPAQPKVETEAGALTASDGGAELVPSQAEAPEAEATAADSAESTDAESPNGDSAAAAPESTGLTPAGDTPDGPADTDAEAEPAARTDATDESTEESEADAEPGEESAPTEAPASEATAAGHQAEVTEGERVDDVTPTEDSEQPGDTTAAADTQEPSGTTATEDTEKPGDRGDQSDDEESFPPRLAELMRSENSESDKAATATPTADESAKAAAPADEEVTASVSADDKAAGTLRGAAARVVRPDAKKSRPKSRR